jgi:hypothetical protein
MQTGQFAAGFGEGLEIGGEGYARQLTFEVDGIAFAVAGMMEQRVEVVEDVFFGNGGVGVVLAKLRYGGALIVAASWHH